MSPSLSWLVSVFSKNRSSRGASCGHDGHIPFGGPCHVLRNPHCVLGMKRLVCQAAAASEIACCDAHTVSMVCAFRSCPPRMSWSVVSVPWTFLPLQCEQPFPSTQITMFFAGWHHTSYGDRNRSSADLRNLASVRPVACATSVITRVMAGWMFSQFWVAWMNTKNPNTFASLSTWEGSAHQHARVDVPKGVVNQLCFYQVRSDRVL